MWAIEISKMEPGQKRTLKEKEKNAMVEAYVKIGDSGVRPSPQESPKKAPSGRWSRYAKKAKTFIKNKLGLKNRAVDAAKFQDYSADLTNTQVHSRTDQSPSLMEVHERQGARPPQIITDYGKKSACRDLIYQYQSNQKGGKPRKYFNSCTTYSCEKHFLMNSSLQCFQPARNSMILSSNSRIALPLGLSRSAR